MNKDDKLAADRSIKIGQGATGSVMITGDHNVVTLGSSKDAKAPRDGGVPRVFISSTSEDLTKYREAAHHAAVGAEFLPVQMEYFAANGQHEPLEACLHKVEDVDVLVLIVAYRYGWVPDDQKAGENKSITWLECEQAHADNKEVLAFLVDESQPWDEKLKEQYLIASAVMEGKATPELLTEVQRNVERLADFKGWINSLGIRVKFTTPEDLGGKVSHALYQWKDRHAKPDTQPATEESNQPSEPKKSPLPTFPPAYREWLQRHCADIELLGVRLKQGQAIKLNHVYVPLITSASKEDSSRKGQEHKSSDPGEIQFSMRREKPQLLLEELDKQSLYVPGDPGSGKSTFCRWVAWLVANGSMPPVDLAADEDYIESFPTTFDQRLPLLIRLRDVWKFLPKDPGRDSLSQTELESVLANWLDTTSPGGLDWADVTPHLEQGSALLIFDGVDEVPLRNGEGRDACYPRAMLLAGLSEAAVAWQKQTNRLLVTSRPYGVDQQQAAKLPLQQAPILQLDDSLQRLLLRRWFRILKDDPEEAEQTAAEMIEHLAERPELSQLITNPMLLTAMCVIYDEGARLPQDKHDLYLRIVDNVLHNRYRNDMSELEMAREHLSVVAYGMHTGAGLDEERTTPQAETSYKEIERMIQRYHDQSAVTFTGYRNALETRDELLQRSGLLLSRGDQKASFYHFTFQDFLAARRMADIERTRMFEIFCQRSETPEWRNTLSFLFSSELANSREQATRLLNRMIEKLTPDSVGLAVIAADCIETMRCRENRLRADVEEKFKSICLAAINNEVEVKARQALGFSLGQLGDPRVIEEILRDVSAYVEIPAGEYAYQDGKQTIDEPFLLAKYPVTNSQFGVFMEEGGYNQRPHWSKKGWEWKEKNRVVEPDYWRDSKFNSPNQPVVGVSFYEAEAFSKWSGGFLPSEHQWEAAARGPDGLEYPWGDNWEDGICNSNEADVGVTSPVGLFPRSRSEYFELEDLSGNVWEWCDSWYDEDRDGRVLRGGSFNDLAHYVRSAVRIYDSPVDRNAPDGFRVARTYP